MYILGEICYDELEFCEGEIVMIRCIVVFFIGIAYLIFGTPLLLMEWIIGKFNPELKSRSSLSLVKWAFGMIARAGGAKVIAIGEDRIPTDTAVLYVGNHRSYYDVILTYLRVPRLTGYVAKKEIEKVPILRSWMRNLHCLFLDRNDIKQGLKTILEAVEMVKNGISVTIFPEGTRNKVPDTILPFHAGSFKIAEKGDVPIVPICIVNSAALWEDHFPKMKKATVIIEYCEPIYMKDLQKEDKKNIANHVSNIIMERYFENKKLLEASDNR